MLFRPVEVLLALGIVVGERTDHDELHARHFFLHDTVGVDHSERVLPRIEARDLQKDRPARVHPELADDLARFVDRHVAVLFGEGVDRRRLDEHLLLQVGSHEPRHRPDRRVMLLHERFEERPHRLVRGREVDVTAPHPPGAVRILCEVTERHRLRVVREDDIGIGELRRVLPRDVEEELLLGV